MTGRVTSLGAGVDVDGGDVEGGPGSGKAEGGGDLLQELAVLDVAVAGEEVVALAAAGTGETDASGEKAAGQQRAVGEADGLRAGDEADPLGVGGGEESGALAVGFDEG